MSLSGPDDPGLTAARKVRDLGDVKALQTEITKAEKKAEETKSFEDYLRLALLRTTICMRQPSRATIADCEGSGAVGGRCSYVRLLKQKLGLE